METCKTCGNTFTRQDSLNRHVNTVCEPPNYWSLCKYCDKYYKQLGKHYQHNPNHRPDISQHQIDILTGILLGDGTIDNRNRGSPRFRVSMVNQEFINHVDKKLHNINTNIIEIEPGKNSVQKQYELYTSTNPKLTNLSKWYSTGDKIYPKNLRINPIILKYWYVTDGHLTNKYNLPSIRCWNERDNIDKIESYFKNTPLNVSFSSGTIRFPKCKNKFFEYIGDPLPGFNYKWPNGD